MSKKKKKMKSSTPSSKRSRKTTVKHLKRWRRATTSGTSSYQLALSQVNEEKENIRRLEKELKAAESAQKIIQELSEKIQNRAHKRIAAVVSKCLTTVWGKKAYEFRIEFEKKRNKTEASLLFYRDGHPVDPEETGGAADIASFALRIACILFSQPKLRKVVVLDEPFKHLHPSVVKFASNLLNELAKELKMQFIIITHLKRLRKGSSKQRKVIVIK